MLTFVTGNTKPYLNGHLTLEDDPDTPINLTGCTVRLQMRKEDDRRFTVNQEVTAITNAANGDVQYQWGENDLNVPGIYQVQYEVTYPDASTQTTAHPELIEVRRA